MRVLDIQIIKYSILFLLLSGLSLAILGYEVSSLLAYNIGYASGYLGFFYLLYRIIIKRIKCPECKNEATFLKKNFSKEPYSKRFTSKLIKLMYGKSDKQLFDIRKDIVYKCNKCGNEFIKKSKPYVLATNKPDEYIVKE